MTYPNGQPHGVNPILAGHQTFLIDGSQVAMEGCETQCGSVLMPRPTEQQSADEQNAELFDYLNWKEIKTVDISNQPASTKTIGIYKVAGWSGSSPELSKVIASPAIQDEILRAWVDSNVMSTDRHEEGFWVVQNPDGTYKPVRFPKGLTRSISPGSPPPGTVSMFHTHPNGPGQGLPFPSNEDMALAKYYHIPGFVASQSGLYIYPGA